MFLSNTTSSTSPSILRSFSQEDGGSTVQSKKDTSASVMTSERDVHAPSPTQEPLSQRMSDSGVAGCADKAFLLTDT